MRFNGLLENLQNISIQRRYARPARTLQNAVNVLSVIKDIMRRGLKPPSPFQTWR